MLSTIFLIIQSFIENLVDKYKGMMMRLSMSILKDYQLSEDNVQEALIILNRKEMILHNLDSPGSKNYIYTVTRNLAIRTVQRNARNDVTFFDEEAFNQLEGEPDVRAFVDQYGFGEDVQALLAELKPEDRDILGYRYGGGYSYREISQMTGIKEAALRKRIERIRHSLQEVIEGQEHEGKRQETK